MKQQNTIFDSMFIDIDDNDKLLLQKVKSPVKVSGGSNMKHVSDVYEEARGVFDKLKASFSSIEFKLITDVKQLDDYLELVKESGIFALDTETSGLNAIDDSLAGICIYSPNAYPAYIPVGHHYYDRNVDATDFIKKLYELNISGTKMIMHNAKFDLRVLKTAYDLWFWCDFDTMIAGRMLDENNSAGLKELWHRFVKPEGVDLQSFTYSDLFKGHIYNNLDPEIVYPYAALDGLMTYQVYMFQKDFLDKDHPYCKELDLVDTSQVYYDIEMQLIHVVAEMEQRGIRLDTELAKELEVKYTQDLEIIERNIYNILDKLWEEIKENVSQKDLMTLSNPIKLNSNQQLQVVLGKGLGMPEAFNSVDESSLEEMASRHSRHKRLIELLMDYRKTNKMLSTYIIALPNKLSPNTGRLHGEYNTIGADTGRLSSKSPNL